MAAGVATVASAVGANREVIEHGRNGLLASTTDGLAWCDPALWPRCLDLRPPARRGRPADGRGALLDAKQRGQARDGGARTRCGVGRRQLSRVAPGAGSGPGPLGAGRPLPRAATRLSPEIPTRRASRTRGTACRPSSIGCYRPSAPAHACSTSAAARAITWPGRGHAATRSRARTARRPCWRRRQRLNPDAELRARAGRRRAVSPTASFDAVLCIEVLRYLPDIGPCVREIARVLRPGGVALVTASPLFNLNGYPLFNRPALAVPLGPGRAAAAVLPHVVRPATRVSKARVSARSTRTGLPRRDQLGGTRRSEPDRRIPAGVRGLRPPACPIDRSSGT